MSVVCTFLRMSLRSCLPYSVYLLSSYCAMRTKYDRMHVGVPTEYVEQGLPQPERAREVCRGLLNGESVCRATPSYCTYLCALREPD